MKLKETDFNLIKINLEFRKQVVIIKSEPYKLFEEIKYKALNKFIDIFYTIPNNLHFYYQGNDLKDKEQEKIGDIFNNKEQITILLRTPKLKLNIKSNSYKSKLSFKDKYITNKDSISFDNNFLLEKTNYCKKDKLRQGYINLKSNPINSLNKFKNIGKSNSMPYISNLNSENNIHETNNILKNKFNFKFNLNDFGNFAYCDKHRYKVSEYCRTCKKFICQECVINQLHKAHLTIGLNSKNLEESIKLYIMILQTNEKKNIKRLNENLNKKENDSIDINILNEKEKDMMIKLDTIINNYHSIMNKVDKKIGNDKKKYRVMVINNFNDVAMRISMQISTILSQFDIAMKKNPNISLEELKYYLDEIGKKEETLELIRERTIKYLLTFEINNKVETTFNKIESTLDLINNKENPFNLDKIYNKELLKIMNIGNENDINKEENNKSKNKKGFKKK